MRQFYFVILESTLLNISFDYGNDSIILDAGDTNTGLADDPNSTASSDLSLSNSKTVEPREDPEVIKQWKENQVSRD